MFDFIGMLDRLAARRRDSVTEAEIDRELHKERKPSTGFEPDEEDRNLLRTIIGSRKALPFVSLKGALLWVTRPKQSISDYCAERSDVSRDNVATSGSHLLVMSFVTICLAIATISGNDIVERIFLTLMMVGVVALAVLMFDLLRRH